mgnify:CR=1 FL=1|jgi:hypothetical protein
MINKEENDDYIECETERVNEHLFSKDIHPANEHVNDIKSRNIDSKSVSVSNGATRTTAVTTEQTYSNIT